MSNRQHTVLACVLALTCLYALRLTSVEVQPWDEGLYAVRAQSIVVYGTWMDQTDHAIGGLYSSTPPPFLPWAGAVSMQLFGPSVAAIRVVGVLCSGVALLLLYGVARRMMSFQSAILAVCVVAGSWHWTIYARQAMTEVPLMMFILFSIWSALQSVESTSTRNTWLFALLAGVGFGAALLTKMTVSFFPLLVLLFLAWRYRTSALPLLLSVITGLAIAAPWYVYMISHHGAPFWNAMVAPQLASDVESTTRSLGILYYVNQLIVAHPLFLAAFAYLIIALWKRSLLPARANATAMIIGVWFILGLIIFSVAPTKNPHYVVMLIPAGVLMSVYGLERILEGDSRRLVVFLYSLIAAGTVWSMNPALRDSMRSLLHDPSMLPMLGIVVLLLVLPFVVPMRLVNVLSARAYRPVVYGVCGIVLLRAVSTIAINPPKLIHGGREVASHLLESQAHSFGYVYHARNDGDVYNPQLAWYTAGWMAGWLPGKIVKSYAMSASQSDENLLAVAAATGTAFIVYYHPGQSTDEQRRVATVLNSSYEIVSTNTEHYTLFASRRTVY